MSSKASWPGETRALVAGQVYEKPDRRKLAELQRAGYLSIEKRKD